MNGSFDWLALSFSVAAIIISLLTLWESSLLPFKLETTTSSPTFKIYDMGSNNWIPSFDIALSFHNTGQRTGQVTDVRLRCRPQSTGVPKDYVFYAKWVVRYNLFEPIRSDRLKWIDTSVTREWYPLILSGKETHQVHLVLEAEIDKMGWHSKQERRMDLGLGILSSDSAHWKEIDTYSIAVDRWMYEKGAGSFILRGAKQFAHRKDNTT